MRLEPEKQSDTALKRIGRYLLMRLEMPVPSYEQRIINNMPNLYREIRPGDVLLVEGRSKLSQMIQVITKSAWSHAAIYVADRLNLSAADAVKRTLNDFSETDRQHMLIEADTGNGVIAVPLSKYQDYNIIGLGRFEYKSIWADE